VRWRDARAVFCRGTTSAAVSATLAAAALTAAVAAAALTATTLATALATALAAAALAAAISSAADLAADLAAALAAATVTAAVAAPAHAAALATRWAPHAPQRLRDPRERVRRRGGDEQRGTERRGRRRERRCARARGRRVRARRGDRALKRRRIRCARSDSPRTRLARVLGLDALRARASNRPVRRACRERSFSLSVCAGVYAADKTALADGRERATQLRARQERGAGARRAQSARARWRPPVTGAHIRLLSG
jgi:hypothetical protein